MYSRSSIPAKLNLLLIKKVFTDKKLKEDAKEIFSSSITEEFSEEMAIFIHNFINKNSSDLLKKAANNFQKEILLELFTLLQQRIIILLEKKGYAENIATSTNISYSTYQENELINQQDDGMNTLSSKTSTEIFINHGKEMIKSRKVDVLPNSKEVEVIDISPNKDEQNNSTETDKEVTNPNVPVEVLPNSMEVMDISDENEQSNFIQAYREMIKTSIPVEVLPNSKKVIDISTEKNEQNNFTATCSKEEDKQAVLEMIEKNKKQSPDNEPYIHNHAALFRTYVNLLMEEDRLKQFRETEKWPTYSDFLETFKKDLPISLINHKSGATYICGVDTIFYFCVLNALQTPYCAGDIARNIQEIKQLTIDNNVSASLSRAINSYTLHQDKFMFDIVNANNKISNKRDIKISNDFYDIIIEDGIPKKILNPAKVLAAAKALRSCRPSNSNTKNRANANVYDTAKMFNECVRLHIRIQELKVQIQEKEIKKAIKQNQREATIGNMLKHDFGFFQLAEDLSDTLDRPKKRVRHESP